MLALVHSAVAHCSNNQTSVHISLAQELGVDFACCLEKRNDPC